MAHPNKLAAGLDEYTDLIADLFKSVSAAVAATTATRGVAPAQILEKLVAKDTELSDMIAEIQTRQSLSREIQQTRDAIAEKDAVLETIETSLREVEASLENVVAGAKRKLVQIEKAEAAKLTDTKLLKFASATGRQASVTAPPDWTPGSQVVNASPYPTQMTIMRSALAQMNAADAAK